MGWKGRDVVFWHSHYRCLLGLVDDPMLCSGFNSQTSVCCLAQPVVPQPWLSALGWAGTVCAFCAPWLLLLCCLRRRMLPQCSEWQLRSCLNLPGWDEGTAELLLCASITAYPVTDLFGDFTFPPTCKTFYHAYLPYKPKCLKTLKGSQKKIYFHKLKTHTKETVEF